MNCDKTAQWKDDYLRSIDFYNDWFLHFAPLAFRTQREVKAKDVNRAFRLTHNLRHINAAVLRRHPEVLPVLRMALAPPIARDRLVGLSYTSKNLVSAMEGSETESPHIPPRLSDAVLVEQLQKIVDVLVEMLDYDLFPWLENDESQKPAPKDVERGIAVIADRLCGAMTDPIIRNAQERRQLDALASFLKALGYCEMVSGAVDDLLAMPRGCYTFRHNVAVRNGKQRVNIPIDCVISRHGREATELPILIEAKSAGDATNTNKRRKEEAQKFAQLKQTFGKKARFILLLCGYFDPGYQGYEAAEGIDWVWEHRLGDLLDLKLEGVEVKQQGMLREAAVEYCADIPILSEQRRFSAQQAVDATKSALERNRLGQFSTPFALASQMVFGSAPWIKHEHPAPLRFLEPACGGGVFISSLRQQQVPYAHATGVEIDKTYSDIAKQFLEGDGTHIEEGNFFDFVQEPSNASCFDWLVTNPPYIRHHHIGFSEKSILQQRVADSLGIHVSGLSGLYIYYILLADCVLKEGAIASWLVPSEFLYTNYGQALRTYLTTHVTLLRLHTFDTEDVLFDDALVSSCIVTYRKAKPPERHTFEATTGHYSAPHTVSRQEIALWRERRKWTFGHTPTDTDAMTPRPAVGDLFHVTRGIATGNNAYFTMTPANARRLQLECDVLIPLLPSPRHVKDSVIHGNSQGFPALEKSRYLFSASGTVDDIERRFPNAYRYLREGESKGIHHGALCRGRKQWYLQERRMPPPYVASYMGRESANGGGNAIRFFLNRTNAIVTNGFICLYPRPFLATLLANDFARQKELLDILNAICTESIVRGGRSYGGGLLKIEPKELSGIKLPRLPSWIPYEHHVQADLFT